MINKKDIELMLKIELEELNQQYDYYLCMLDKEENSYYENRVLEIKHEILTIEKVIQKIKEMKVK